MALEPGGPRYGWIETTDLVEGSEGVWVALEPTTVGQRSWMRARDGMLEPASMRVGGGVREGEGGITGICYNGSYGYGRFLVCSYFPVVGSE